MSKLSPIPIQDRDFGSPNWIRWFEELSSFLSGTRPNREYTVGRLPSARENKGASVLVTDEAGGAVLAFSDGTNWRRCTDRAVVS